MEYVLQDMLLLLAQVHVQYASLDFKQQGQCLEFVNHAKKEHMFQVLEQQHAVACVLLVLLVDGMPPCAVYVLLVLIMVLLGNLSAPNVLLANTPQP